MRLYGGIDLHSNNSVKRLNDEEVDRLLPDGDLTLAVKSNLAVMRTLDDAIKRLKTL